MAQNQFGGGAAPATAPAPAPTPTSVAQDLPPAAKTDLDQAKEVKDLAAKDYKAKDFDKACEKYFQIINIVRSNDQLKTS